MNKQQQLPSEDNPLIDKSKWTQETKDAYKHMIKVIIGTLEEELKEEDSNLTKPIVKQ